MTVPRTLLAATAGLALLLGAVVALGAGALALEHRAGAHLDAAVSVPLAALLPDGRVDDVDVTDSPALLAARRDRLQQAVLHGRSAGHDVLTVVRGYDRPRATVESVSWEVSGIAFAPGWANVRAPGGAYTDRARTTVGGHVYEVTASTGPAQDRAQREGAAGAGAPTVVVRAATLAVDGAPLAPADAPQAVRAALAPVTVAVPDARAGAAVRRVWFDEAGVGVELYAQDVSAGPA